jgi:hypothetical protein
MFKNLRSLKKKKNVFTTFFFISIIYISLILSTSYHTVSTPPDVTFEPGAFHVQTSKRDKGDPLLSKYFTDHGIIYDHLFHNGKWDFNFHPRIMTGFNDLWKSSGTVGDNAYYLIYAGYYSGLIEKPEYNLANSNKFFTVFKYRIFVPYLVAQIYKTINFLKLKKVSEDNQWNEKNISKLVYIFLVINYFSVFLTALILFYYLKNIFNFNFILSLVGGIFFITSLIVERSINFPQTESFACLITILLFYNIYYKNYLTYISLALIGVASRDIFLFSSVLFFFNINFKIKKDILKGIVLSLIPILFYIFIRIYINQKFSLEITYGRDLLKDPFVVQGLPILSNFNSFVFFIFKLFLVFGFFWIGIYNLKKNKFLMRTFPCVIFLILINLLFVGNGSGIARHLGLMFPIIIPAFLFFFKSKNLI